MFDKQKRCRFVTLSPTLINTDKYPIREISTNQVKVSRSRGNVIARSSQVSRGLSTISKNDEQKCALSYNYDNQNDGGKEYAGETWSDVGRTDGMNAHVHVLKSLI